MLPAYVQFAFEKRAGLASSAGSGVAKWVTKVLGSRAGSAAGQAVDKVAPYAKNWGQRLISRPKWLGGTGQKVETLTPSWMPFQNLKGVRGGAVDLAGFANPVTYPFFNAKFIYEHPKLYAATLPLTWAVPWAIDKAFGGGSQPPPGGMRQAGAQAARPGMPQVGNAGMVGSGPGYNPAYNEARSQLIRSWKRNPNNFSMFRKSPLVLSRY